MIHVALHRVAGLVKAMTGSTDCGRFENAHTRELRTREMTSPNRAYVGKIAITPLYKVIVCKDRAASARARSRGQFANVDRARGRTVRVRG